MRLFTCQLSNQICLSPGAVAESVERGPRVQEIRSSVLDRVKPMTCTIDTSLFIAKLAALIG